MTGSTAIAVLLFAVVSALPAQQTFVVDPTGQGTHKTVQAAVDAARDQDRILILPGVYEEYVTVTAKSLWIAGAAEGPTLRCLEVISHPASRTMRLSNLKIADKATFAVKSCSFTGSGHLVMERVEIQTPGTVVNLKGGHVMLQSSKFGGLWIPTTFVTSINTNGLEVLSHDLLVLSDCSVVAMGSFSGFLGAKPAGKGLTITGGRAEISATTIRGGGGASYLCGMDVYCGTAGARGLVLTGARVRLRGSSSHTVSGGHGGWSRNYTGSWQAAGGDAIFATAKSILEYSGVTLRPGTKGGKALNLAATCTTLRITPNDPLLILTRGFVFGSSAVFALEAKPSSVAAVLLTLSASPLDTPFGPLYCDLASLITTFAATIDATGNGSLSIPTGSDLDILGLPLYLQAVEIDARLQLRLTGMVASIPGVW